ncbi:glycosyltransferase [Niallia sp. XMNu-256]|uniref:glycosyltransferase n=1 Tax=Niallia sp. XMNu-256 TaxID=3082444 RepID=UPI0030D5DFC5
MVFDVPAEHGGALSILHEFYNEVKSYDDKQIKWFFILSKPKLHESENIKVLRFPWIKKSWMHRLFFDYLIAPRLVKKYKVDKIISFQNVMIPKTKVPQVIYVHQSLPFVKYKFSFKENRLLWVYQNIIGRSITNSMKKAQRVIVQTEWMREACLQKAKLKKENIIVVPPQFEITVKKYFVPNKKSCSTFFYPAGPAKYKNHGIIIEACKILQQKYSGEFKIIFTLNGDENDHICNIRNEVKSFKLPVEFKGTMKRERVFDMYTNSVLLFPSYIETYGLPLLEAMMHKGFILASDLPFANEVLDGYPNVDFFDPFNKDDLAEKIYRILNNDSNYTKQNYKINNQTNFKRIIDYI